MKELSKIGKSESKFFECTIKIEGKMSLGSLTERFFFQLMKEKPLTANQICLNLKCTCKKKFILPFHLFGLIISVAEH